MVGCGRAYIPTRWAWSMTAPRAVRGASAVAEGIGDAVRSEGSAADVRPWRTHDPGLTRQVANRDGHHNAESDHHAGKERCTDRHQYPGGYLTLAFQPARDGLV